MKRIKILGYDYEIIPSPAPEAGGMKEAGRLFCSKQIIPLDMSACQQAQESTLIHEIFEALNYHFDLELTHEAISALETGWFTVLHDNGVDISGLLKDKEDFEIIGKNLDDVLRG
jgi:hypothetical protein